MTALGAYAGAYAGANAASDGPGEQPGPSALGPQAQIDSIQLDAADCRPAHSGHAAAMPREPAACRSATHQGAPPAVWV